MIIICIAYQVLKNKQGTVIRPVPVLRHALTSIHHHESNHQRIVRIAFRISLSLAVRLKSRDFIIAGKTIGVHDANHAPYRPDHAVILSAHGGVGGVQRMQAFLSILLHIPAGHMEARLPRCN